MSSRDSQKTKIGRLSAASLIVASMVGAGIFTTPGTIAGLVGTSSGILLSWLLGGIVAFSGALVIAELGAAIPEQGGPYAYFHRIYGERSAFLVGFLSATVGYFAAAAAVALSTGVYFSSIFPDVPPQISATVLLIGLTLVHSSTLRSSARFNDIACLLKLLLLAVFIIAGALVAGPGHTPIATESAGEFSAGGLASAMVLVFFAYSGWDTAAYVANEIDRPQKNLPWAIMLGSGLIVVFYLAINLIYLKAATPSEMAGVHDVGRLAAMNLFGDSVGTLFTGGIILLLISTCSAITFVGPRVVVAMSNRGQTPSLFGRLNSRGAPSKALWIQATCMISLVWLVDIDSLFQYVGLLLSGCAVFTIYCAILFRRREPHAPRPFQMPLYPLPALVFMGFSIYTIVWSVQETPWPLVASGATIIAISILRPLLRQSR